MFVLNANNAKPLPKLLNQESFFQTAYPKQGFVGYNGAPSGSAKVGLVNMNQNISYGIADQTIIETVGSTQINGYFRNIVDAFLATGNFYTTSGDYGTNAEMEVGWQAQNGEVTLGTYTFSLTSRFASPERLLAGKNVGANITLAAAFKWRNNAGQSGLQVSFTNTTATLVFKLMRTDGTLVTIGTITTPVVGSASNVTQNTVQYTLGSVVSSSFTPVTSQEGDRIVVDITLAGTCQAVSMAGGGGSGSIMPVTCGLGFGYVGSNRQVASDYFAARPFQVSIT